MSNMLCMDLRRLFRSRSFKVVLLVTAVLMLMVSFMAAIVSDPEMLDEMDSRGAEIEEIDRQISEEIRDMTQLELAQQMGVTDKAVSKWERDLSFPDVAMLGIGQVCLAAIQLLKTEK